MRRMQAAHSAVVDAVNELEVKEHLVLRRKEDNKLTIWSFTPRANWLDVVEIVFVDPSSDDSEGSPMRKAVLPKFLVPRDSAFCRNSANV